MFKFNNVAEFLCFFDFLFLRLLTSIFLRLLTSLLPLFWPPCFFYCWPPYFFDYWPPGSFCMLTSRFLLYSYLPVSFIVDLPVPSTSDLPVASDCWPPCFFWLLTSLAPSIFALPVPSLLLTSLSGVQVIQKVFCEGLVTYLDMKQEVVDRLFPQLDTLISIHFEFLRQLRIRQVYFIVIYKLLSTWN